VVNDACDAVRRRRRRRKVNSGFKLKLCGA
jgi:hypothetical protein